jgi:CO dehydrogenase maturation factor
MEHISRVTTQHVDLLLVVSDPSRRSLQAAQRVTALAKEMKVLRGKAYLVLSMVRGDPSPELLSTVKEMGLELAGVVPDDPMLADYDLKGLPTSTLPMESPAKRAAFKVFDKVMAEVQG